MSRERLDRLMKKLPDGSYEVVGYEKHEASNITNYKIEIFHSPCGLVWSKILYATFHPPEGTPHRTYHHHYIPHDRIDQYTGVDVGKDKLFERDKVSFYHVSGRIQTFVKGPVVFRDSAFKIEDKFDTGTYHSLVYASGYGSFKIIGIEGVSSKN